MFVVTVHFSVFPESSDVFASRVMRQATDSLNLEEGCHVFDVCRDQQDETHFFLYEVYTDKAAFDLHLESAHFQAFDNEVRDQVTDKRVEVFSRTNQGQ